MRQELAVQLDEFLEKGVLVRPICDGYFLTISRVQNALRSLTHCLLCFGQNHIYPMPQLLILHQPNKNH